MGCAGLIQISEGNHIVISRILGIADVSADSMKAKLGEADRAGRLINFSGENDIKSVLLLDDRSVILTALCPNQLASMISEKMLSEVVVNL